VKACADRDPAFCAPHLPDVLRHRVDLARHPALAVRACGRAALHCAQQAAAEQLR
jgi:hypothetical protein